MIEDLNCFRIFNANYIDKDILASYEISSVATQFPVENIFNQNRRSKVCRTNGYWKVTPENNRIYFSDTNNIFDTAILNTGNYHSSTSFFAEIERALNNTMSLSTYTVSFDNLRIKIESDGVGGDGTFALDYGYTTLRDELGLTSDKSGSLSLTMDKAMIHGTLGEYIEFDMGVATNPDCFFAIDQKDASIQLSPTAIIKLQGNETGNFSNPSYEATIDYDDEVLSLFSENGLATKAYRYWRLYFYDASNPNQYLQIGSVFLGNFLAWDRARPSFPLRQNYIDRSITLFSDGGQTITDIKSKSQTFSVKIGAMTKQDIESFDIFFNDFGTGKPFFVSMDTNKVFSTNRNRRVMLCKFKGTPSYEFVSPDYFILTMTLREEM